MIYNKEKIGDLEIHYRNNERKEAPSIFLIHGLGCSLRYWDLLFNDPIAEFFDLWAVDLIGHGESSKPKKFSYAMETQAEILVEFIKKKGISPVCLVGFSMGGPISILIAEQLPNLHKLVLVEPVVIEAEVTLSKKTAKMPPFTVSILKFIAKLFPKFFARMFLLNPDSINSNIVLESFLKTDNVAFVKSSKELLKSARNPLTYEKLKNLSVDKYYILGDVLEKSPHFSPPEDLFSVCKKYVVPDSEHPVMLDNPKTFADILAEILAES
ncbi:MAG: alpha/beta fold hydrolase [Candidatus Heimdallarchaeaceae archaeon]